ncbi:MAG: hypothetical protein IJ770_00355 [Alphaproteobacteria bacterium]|nr:hypothetical protein [Alphaproteobacteria bacterium]
MVKITGTVTDVRKVNLGNDILVSVKASSPEEIKDKVVCFVIKNNPKASFLIENTLEKAILTIKNSVNVRYTKELTRESLIKDIDSGYVLVLEAHNLFITGL